jgi:succinate-acetate transporter protein
VHPQVRVVVRPYASAVPLGFFAFGIGMFLYAALDAPWVEPKDWRTLGLLLAAFVAPIYQLGGGAAWNRIGGWLALAIFCVAMYGGLAFLLEEAVGRAVLPLGRTGGSREAMEGSLADQLRGLADEPGVRHTL